MAQREPIRARAGPAPQPLAAIVLDYSAASDGLFAAGTSNGERVNAFFAELEARLTVEHGGRERTRAAGTSRCACSTRPADSR